MGAGRECRYSGARRDIGGIRGHWAPRGVGGCWASLGVGGVRGVLGAGRESRYSGARRGIGGIRRHLGLLGVLGPSEGVRGIRGVLGLAGSVCTQGQKVWRWHKGAFGLQGGVGDHKGDVRENRCQRCLGAGSECRYSGARRGIGGIRAFGGS